RPLRSALLPYTTLFRSRAAVRVVIARLYGNSEGTGRIIRILDVEMADLNGEVVVFIHGHDVLTDDDGRVVNRVDVHREHHLCGIDVGRTTRAIIGYRDCHLG